MSLFNSPPDLTRKITPDLYSYVVRYDDGAAPNPFRGLCSLAICKPGIRRTARPGDWIAGLGSARDHQEHHLIYAMQVEQVLNWRDYNRLAPVLWPHRIPDSNVQNADLTSHLGDCLYYPTDDDVAQRLGVHSAGPEHRRRHQQAKDLNGFILLSTRFLYFGASAKPLRNDGEFGLHDLLVRGGQGHRRQANLKLVPRFVAWYEQLERELGNGQHGWPHMVVRGGCAGCMDHDMDEEADLEAT